jgi:hypothetical protein
LTDQILATLRQLDDDESLLVQSGKPVGVFKTHSDAPRVLMQPTHGYPEYDRDLTIGAGVNFTMGRIEQLAARDSRVLPPLGTDGKPQLVDRFIEALRSIEGAYSLVALSNKKLIGARDPHGFWPLVLGRIGELMVAVAQFDAARVELETLGDRRIARPDARDEVRGHAQGARAAGRVERLHATLRDGR